MYNYSVMEYIDLRGILAKILFFYNPKCFANCIMFLLLTNYVAVIICYISI